MLGMGEMNIPRAEGIRVTDVVEHSLLDLMLGCLLPTLGTGTFWPDTALPDHLRLGQVLLRKDILSGIRGILANWTHSDLPSESLSKG